MKTDHKPLIYFFSEKKVILTLASGCVQRWALALEAYRYSIQYCEGEDNVTADAMSRLSIETTPLDPPIPCEVIHLMEYLDTSQPQVFRSKHGLQPCIVKSEGVATIRLAFSRVWGR